MKIIRNISRVLVGMIFIFSGFVKIIDPLGSTYKFMDYFTAMNLEFLAPAALSLAILMCLAELIIGIMLFLNLLPRFASWGVLFFMVAFTPLTLWIALNDPVQDCGCFGDAIIFTNWETFYKNIFILALTIVIFIQRKQFKPYFTKVFQYALTIIFTFSGVWISIHGLNNLPVLDFRPYHIGANISEGMSIPEHEKDNVDVYDSFFIYEKDGEQKSFRVDELPDESWTFIDAEHVLVKKGYEPPITNFVITKIIEAESENVEQESTEINDEINHINLYEIDFVFEKDDVTETFYIDQLPDNTWVFVEVHSNAGINPKYIELTYLNLNSGDEKIFTIDHLPDTSWVFIDAEYITEGKENNLVHDIGADVTDYILEDENYSFLVIMPEIQNTSTKNLEKIVQIANYCTNTNNKFYCITGSSSDKIEEFLEKNAFDYDFYSADPITLKTIVRSNPGLVLLQKGTVLNKWSHKNIPDVSEFSQELNSSALTDINKDKENLIIWMYLLVFISFSYLIYSFHYRLVKNNFISKK
jgi:uncharacterized membrane protein YphA (DoxX/SURF4 family)